MKKVAHYSLNDIYNPEFLTTKSYFNNNTVCYYYTNITDRQNDLCNSNLPFCYFMAKLEDVETKGSKPIIWIDDPISSLDSNHIFFVYSLINAEIIEKEEEINKFVAENYAYNASRGE